MSKNEKMIDFFCPNTEWIEEPGIDIVINITVLGMPESEYSNIYDDFLAEISETTVKAIKDGTIKFLDIEALEKSKTDTGLIDPVEMLDDKYADKCFQQYSDGVPTKWYYKNCGRCEPSVICIWYDDESKKYRLSTDDRDELASISSFVKCKVIDPKEMPIKLP